jgi:hypothetical protein
MGERRSYDSGRHDNSFGPLDQNQRQNRSFAHGLNPNANTTFSGSRNYLPTIASEVRDEVSSIALSEDQIEIRDGAILEEDEE